MEKFTNAIASSLFILIIQVFTMPIKVVKKSINAVLSASKDTEDTEFVITMWCKNSYEAIIVLTYPIFALLIIIGVLSSGFHISTVLPLFLIGYFLPILLGLFKEMLAMAVIQVVKLEEIARNTKKD